MSQVSKVDRRKRVKKGRELSSRWPDMFKGIESVNRGPTHLGNRESFGMARTGRGKAGTKAGVGGAAPKGLTHHGHKVKGSGLGL